MSYKSNMKTSLLKGKAKSMVKFTNASQHQESNPVQHVTKDIGEDTSQIASGEKHAKELSSNSQTISKSQKEHAPIQTDCQTSTTNLETPKQVLTPETGMKRKLEEEEQEQPAKKSKEDEEEEPNYLYEFKDKIVAIDPKQYMNEYVKKNGSKYMKILSIDYSCWDNIPLNLQLGHDVFKQSSYALALVPSPRNFEEYNEMRYPLAFFIEKFVACVPNQYAIKGINFVNGVDIIDCFKWLHAIANSTDFEDFVKIIIGSSCLADRHRAKRYNALIFNDFVLRRLGVAFLGYFCNKCEVARGILQAKDDDIDFNSISEHIMNEVISDDDDDKFDIWDF